MGVPRVQYSLRGSSKYGQCPLHYLLTRRAISCNFFSFYPLRALEGQQLDLSGSSPCAQPPKVGHCRAKSPKFYFDPASSTCKMFFYGGCGGNDNR